MPDRYAVIGNPIAHSKSPALHTAFARQCAQDIVYEAIYGPLDRFAECVMSFRASGP
jgi:shikimate dehydrogenase